MWWSFGRVAVLSSVTVTLLLIAVGEQAAHGARPDGWVFVALTAQLVLGVAGGLFAALSRPRHALAAVLATLTLAGFVVAGRSAPFDAIGVAGTALAAPALLALVATLEPWRPRSIRILVTAVAALSVIRVLVYDPFLDVGCSNLCRPSPIAMTHLPDVVRLAGAIAAAATVAVAALAFMLAIRARSLHPSQRPVRRVATAAALLGALVLGVTSAIRLALGNLPVLGDTSADVLAPTSLAALLVAGGITLTACEPLIARRDVERVARLLAVAGPGAGVEAIFRQSFDDPGLRLGYWVDGTGYCDAAGRPVEAGQFATAELTVDAAPMAILIHGGRASAADVLDQQLGPLARVVVHNEAMILELDRRAADLAVSRLRIVEAGENERRNIERDLHDGAQQRLLALLFALRRGERAVTVEGDHTAATAFRSAGALTETALGQLRDVAHGIYPATLAGAGLGDSVVEAAAQLDLDVDIRVLTPEPLPPGLASAFYWIAHAALAEMAQGKTPLQLRVERRDGMALMRFEGVAELPASAIDRAAAANGTCRATAAGMEVRFPCAS